jgi:hypothetical protein
LRKLREQFPNELVVIGVHSAKFPSEKSTENIRQAVMREGIGHPVVNDAGFKTWNAYTVNAWPTLVLINPSGRIAGETTGEILAEEFAQNIRDIIEQDPSGIDLNPLEFRPEAEMEPEHPLRYPAKLLLSDNRLFVADTGHHRILELRLDADGLGGELVRVFGRGEPGLQDGAADQAAFNHPHGMSISGDLNQGTLYVADTENHAIRAIHLDSGEVITVAGTGQNAHGKRSMGAPTETALRSPWSVLALEEYVFIAMAGSHQIWVLINDNQLGPFAGNGREALVDGPAGEASFNQPSDLAFGLGHLFVADAEASAIRAISLDKEAKVQTIVGQGLFDWGDKDGQISEALLQHATGLTFNERVLYVADTYNHKIKLLDPVEGQISTLVGSGEAGLMDGSFEEARLFEPEGLQVHQGHLYIADTNNHQIRVADLKLRTVTTFHMKGLERLPAASTAKPAIHTLERVSARPGKLQVTLDVRLPEGYHRNTEMPAHLVVGERTNAAAYTFGETEDIVFTVEADATREIPLELTLYYCSDGNTTLCLIHSRTLVLPVEIDAAAGDQVEIAYPVAGSVSGYARGG